MKRFWVSLILVLLVSCAPKRIALPSLEGVDFNDYMGSLGSIYEIETAFSIVFERNDSEMRGDAALDISRTGDMNLRVYSLGFLAAELSSSDGVVKSDPPIDRTKTLILTRGLRDCLFWWDVQDGDLWEEDGLYRLRNSYREVWIDKKTFLPERQVIRLGDGKELDIRYGEPAMEDGRRYQSKINIRFSRYVVTLAVERMSFKT